MDKRARDQQHAFAPQPETILLVDDQDDYRITTKWLLNAFGYAVDSAPSAEAALARFNPRVHALVITDNRMPGMSGLEMAQVLKLRSPSLPVLMYTGLPPANQACLDVVLQRPEQLLELKGAVDRLLAQQRDYCNNQETKLQSRGA